MHAIPKVNEAILGSIPIDKKLKSYFKSKYRHLAKHNGPSFAADAFSELRTIMLAYRADPNRMKNREGYIRKCPVRKNGWLRKLFDYLDSHPEYALNFVKMYVGLNEPLVTVEQSANNQHSYLQSVAVDTAVPKYLAAWVSLIKEPLMTKEQWFIRRHGKTRRGYDGVVKFLRTHSYLQYRAYVSRWKRIFDVFIDGTEVQKALEKLEPVPEMYKDCEGLTSVSLERHLWGLSAFAYKVEGGGWSGEPSISPKSYNFVLEALSPNLLSLFDEIENGGFRPDEPLSILDGETVGQVHHIPKKGTIKRRPIAVPNRFFQMGMGPATSMLEAVVKRLPKDATYDQSRFDTQITNRVTNPALYVGSVDLSQATDNLPLSWGEHIVSELVLAKQLPEVKTSWQLFMECSRAEWDNDGQLTRWTVGQPLGCRPSFSVLAITHNIVLESLSWWLGYGHSPYAVLGDDVVIFTKKLRGAYIRDFGKRGIPLSLHKSFEGNLTEFAGKVYIRNHTPFHTSDQIALTWSNLFDYQVATGILIPWDKLPRPVRNRFEREVSVVFGNRQFPARTARKVYHLIQMANVHRASGHFDYEAKDQALTNYFTELYREESLIPSPINYSGSVKVAGHPITYLNYGYAEKRGHKQRFINVKLPEWYRDKFRPVTTDKLVRCATIALKNLAS